MNGWGWLFVCVALLFGYRLGWIQAHKTVAKECEQLGAFYVGDSVYECYKVEQRETLRRQQ